MTKIIVGIHGLANKPEKKVLAEWWERSIREGLEKNCGLRDADFEFKPVYWADLLYANPLHDNELMKFDHQFNGEPYVRAAEGSLIEHKDGLADDLIAGALGLVGSTVDFLKERFEMDKLADWVLGKALKDLAFYYDESREIGDRSTPPLPTRARKVMMDELTNTLLPLKGEEIMLIAHSMGTIIAYDVLRDIGRHDPVFEVAHFVTIGSPLGIPHVRNKIIEERAYHAEEEGKARVRTPSVVTRSWVNFADRRDPVALDVHLADDYGRNGKGVCVKDDLVLNSYKSSADEPNYHKSYGYLRTPELSRHLRDFLNEE